jgi:hypothetical protein
MADTKISALTDAGALSASDKLVLARGGANYSVNADMVLGFMRHKVFTANGSVVSPDWATKCWIKAAAPGGGGGGAINADSAAGSGSSGMSLNFQEFTISPAQTITIACGNWSGGAGGVAGNNAGTNGADLTINGAGLAITLVGGRAGSGGGLANGVGTAGASAGSGSMPGGPCYRAIGDSSWSGHGGASPFGAGAPGAIAMATPTTDMAGFNATYPGTGGSGGVCNHNAPTAQPGGQGGPGRVEIHFGV